MEPNQPAVRDSCKSVQEAVVGQRPKQDCKVNQAQPASRQASPAHTINGVTQLYIVTLQSKTGDLYTRYGVVVSLQQGG